MNGCKRTFNFRNLSSITGETSNSRVMSAFAAVTLNRAVRLARSGSPAV